MKKFICKLFILLIFSSLLYSCATNKSIAQRIEDFNKMAPNEIQCFIQKNDGTIKYFTTLKLVTGVFTSPHLLADGQIKIRPEEIKAYQNEEYYAISQKIFFSGKPGHIARKTLPGFAIRVVKGKLNVYCKKFFNGERAMNEYFLQSGEDGEIRSYSPELMSSIVKSDEAAYNYFNKKNEKKITQDRILATAQMFNDKQFVSKN